MGYQFSNLGGSATGGSSSITCQDLLSRLASCPSKTVPPEALITSADIYILLLGANNQVYWVTLQQLHSTRPFAAPEYTSDTEADVDASLPEGAVYAITGPDRGLYIKPVTT